MAITVILTGGGLKGAVAAARYAAEHELCLLHIDHGQRSAKAELEALGDLVRGFRSAYVLPLTAEFVKQLEQPRARAGVAKIVEAERDPNQPTAAQFLAQRGLAVSLLAMGLQAANRLGSTLLVTGLSRHCEIEHIGLSKQDGHPDQLRELVHAMNIVAEAASRTRVRIEAPLMDLTYPEIVKLAARLNLRTEHTWTCEARGNHPCGDCAPCKERDAAFHEAKLTDAAMRATATMVK